MPDILSEMPVLDEYPRNEVEIQLENGEQRRLYIDGRAISRTSETMEEIENAVADYIGEHDRVSGAAIFRVDGPDDRVIQKSI